MKKNLACFLAAVMTITAMPVNAFAWGNGNGTQATVRLANNPPIVANGNGQQVEIGAVANTGARLSEDDLFAHKDWFPANDLLVIFGEDEQNIASPMQFVIELENANFRFRSGSENYYDTARGSFDGNTYTRYVDPLMLFYIDEATQTLSFSGTASGSWTDIILELAGVDATGAFIPGAPRYITVNASTDAARLAALLDFRAELEAIPGISNPGNGVAGMAALRNFDFATAGISFGVPLYTLEISRGNASRAVVTIAEGFDFNDFVANDRQEAIPRSVEVPDYTAPTVQNPVVDPVEPSAPQQPVAEAPEVVETFGKKKQEEQAPEGETEQENQVQPARTTEAVLVDAMDETDYAAISATQADDAEYKASIQKLKEAEAALENVIAELKAGKISGIVATAVNPESATLNGAVDLMANAIASIRSTAGLTKDDLVAMFEAAMNPGTTRLSNLDEDGFLSNDDAVNPFAGIARELSDILGTNFDLTGKGGNPVGNRNERITFYLNAAAVAAQAALVRLNSLPEATGTLVPTSIPVAAIINNLQASIANLQTIARLISNTRYSVKETVTLSKDTGIRIPLVVQGTNGNVDRSVRIVDSTFPVQNTSLVFSRSGAGGRTIASVNGTATGRDRIRLNAITLMETRPRVLPMDPDFTFPGFNNGEVTGWVFEMVAPTGYRFANNLQAVDSNGNRIVQVNGEGGIIEVNNGTVAFVPGTDNRVVAVGYNSLDRGTSGLTGAQSR